MLCVVVEHVCVHVAAAVVVVMCVFVLSAGRERCCSTVHLLSRDMSPSAMCHEPSRT